MLDVLQLFGKFLNFVEGAFRRARNEWILNLWDGVQGIVAGDRFCVNYTDWRVNEWEGMRGKDVDELKIWIKNVGGKREEGEGEGELYITHPFIFTCGLGLVKGKERKGLSNLFPIYYQFIRGFGAGGKLGGF